jgi:hypothetical protein
MRNGRLDESFTVEVLRDPGGACKISFLSAEW